MAVTVEYKVHGVGETTVSMQADVGGELLPVTTRCLEVELVSVDGRHGNPILRFVGGTVAEAQALFATDGVVTATFE